MIAGKATGSFDCAPFAPRSGAPLRMTWRRGANSQFPALTQMRICAIDPVDLFHLSRAERFVFVQAPKSLEQALPAQHFVQAGDAAAEAVGGVEERGVAIGD